MYPASATKFWMVAFAVGLVIASFGAASALTFPHLPAWTSQVNYYATLKFIPRAWRNLLFIVGGALSCAVALVQLNKSLMRAFARADDGDLAGIIRAPLPNNTRSSTGEKYSPLGQGIRDGTQMHADARR